VLASLSTHEYRLKETIIYALNLYEASFLEQPIQCRDWNSVVARLARNYVARAVPGFYDEIHTEIVQVGTFLELPQLENNHASLCSEPYSIRAELNRRTILAPIVTHSNDHQASCSRTPKKCLKCGSNIMVSQKVRNGIVGAQNYIKLSRVRLVASAHVGNTEGYPQASLLSFSLRALNRERRSIGTSNHVAALGKAQRLRPYPAGCIQHRLYSGAQTLSND